VAKVSLKSAVRHIEEAGVVLVFPINNRKAPASLWSCFYPRSKMKWEWDSGGDNRVANLWYLREELSRSNQVVYAKWYQGRATFFSRQIFTALLSLMEPEPALSRQADEVLRLLLEDSPLSTKEVKAAADLRGRELEPIYSRAMKELWSRLLIVGYGEKDDGAFPSLAIGATQVLFEDLWSDAWTLSTENAMHILKEKLGSSPFLRYHFLSNERYNHEKHLRSLSDSKL
jgi:hypothetical protein